MIMPFIDCVCTSYGRSLGGSRPPTLFKNGNFFSVFESRSVATVSSSSESVSESVSFFGFETRGIGSGFCDGCRGFLERGLSI